MSILEDMEITEGSGSSWTMQDEAEYDFLHMKYADRRKLGEEWIEKRKIASMNKTAGPDGKPTPHHTRMQMEADIARMAYDMAYILESNRRLQQQVRIIEQVFDRVALLEGAYGHLRQSTDYVKDQYKDSMRRHYEERKEFQTRIAMQQAGLNPDSKEDRLRWAAQLDELTARIFNTQPKEQAE